jgi:hypothetical protein
VDLRDRGRGDGFAELGKKLVDRNLQLGLDHRLGLVGREGWQLVLQDAQLHRQFVAHNVRPGRKNLPELDVGRAQCGQRAGRRRLGGIAAIPQPLERPAQNRATIRRLRGARKASRTTPIAPVRSSVAPVRTSRQMLWGPLTSELPARMKCRDAHRQVAVFHLSEARIADHARELS